MSKLLGFASACGMLAAGLCVAQADSPRFDVKPGLWEMTSKTQSTGTPPIPPEALAHMTPQQRETMQQHMRESMGDRTQVSKHCVTEQKLRDLDFGNDSPSCHKTVLSRTPRMVELREECTGREKVNGILHIEAVDREHFSGRFNMQMTNGTDTMTINQTMQGNWLGSDCGGVKD
jgi:hypothetical protein